MGIVQDSLLGLHLLTQQSTFFDHAHLCRALGGLRHVDRTLPAPCCEWVGRKEEGGSKKKSNHLNRLWSGKQVFSMLLPPTFCIGELAPPKNLEVDSSNSSSPPISIPPISIRSFFPADCKLPVVVREGQMVCGVVCKAHVGTSAGGIVDVLCRDYGGGVACMRFMGDVQRLTHAFLLQRGHAVGIDDVMLSLEGHARVSERLAKVKGGK